MIGNNTNTTFPSPLKHQLLPAAGFVLLLCLTGQPALAQQSTSQAPSPRIQMLLKSGAYDLALRRINDIQNGVDETAQWLEWEKLRFDLYRRRQEWDKLSERLLNLPADVPEIQRQELMTRAAELLLESGRGDDVRDILRALIWRGSGDSKQLNYWRRLVVRSYLADESVRDASIAMSLYDREYLPADSAWDYLYAQVLLRRGDAAQAAHRLGSAQEPAARVLRLLSRLRAGVDSPELVLEKSAGLRDALSGNPALVAACWAVSAEAALQGSDLAARVEALEQLFDGPGLPSDFTLFDLQVADLWRAYEALGSGLGNERNLLFGDPEPWMSLALSLKGAGSALRARAINAAVARNSRSASEREQLHLALYERLETAGLTNLAVRLYESEAVFASMDDVPNTVRHRIVAAAIDQRDLGLAASFARHLTAPNAEQTQVQWDLTRARLALYAGDFSQSESILRSLILSHEKFEPEAADRVMQPIFDLQSVGRGQAAFELLQYLRDRVTTDKHRREILLWLGDARKTQSDYETAAEYYLRSAYAAAGGKDQWGQSARYHAAEALAEADLFEDARRIYEQLLTEVGEGKRAAALERRLQELWVKKQERGREN